MGDSPQNPTQGETPKQSIVLEVHDVIHVVSSTVTHETHEQKGEGRG